MAIEPELLKIWSDIKDKLGIMDANQRALAKIQRTASKAMVPYFNQVTGSVVPNSSGFGVIALGKPEQGMIRYIRGLCISGTTPTTAVAGRGDVFVKASAPPSGSTDFTYFPMSDWRDQATTLPNRGNYGRGALALHAGEHLYLVLSSATTAIEYVATAYFEDFQEAALNQDYER